jgi:uncharacterized protein
LKTAEVDEAHRADHRQAAIMTTTSGPREAVPPPLEIRRAPEPLFGDRISATTLYLLHKCDRRLWLGQHRPDLAAPPGDFERLLWEKGRQHERGVRESRFAAAAGPVYFGQPVQQAAEETLRLIEAGSAALYQPLFLSRDGRRVGVPDFLYRDGDRLVVHDAKLAVNLDAHAEIGLQLAHYARLLEERLGARPARLEITNGAGDVLLVEDLADVDYEQALARARALVGDGPEPDLLQTHSVCAECPFYDHCWDRAVKEDRIEVLREVTRKVAKLLHGIGIHTVERLAAAEPRQIRMKGIADTAEAIVAEARAHRDRRAVWLMPPQLPPWPVVWFDLEGDPEGEEVDRAIYLWGLAVDDGRSNPRVETITADFDDQGGRRAWERFVARATEILDRQPNARWVHYSPYEKTWVRNYVKAHGAPAGFLERMEEALFDLLNRGVRRSVRLPVYSYSIKQVARLAGFEWRNPDSGSVWSMVQYQKACASRDPAERARIVCEIEEYNADDLLAMRAVWHWLLREGPKGHCG